MSFCLARVIVIGTREYLKVPANPTLGKHRLICTAVACILYKTGFILMWLMVLSSLTVT